MRVGHHLYRKNSGTVVELKFKFKSRENGTSIDLIFLDIVDNLKLLKRYSWKIICFIKTLPHFFREWNSRPRLNTSILCALSSILCECFYCLLHGSKCCISSCLKNDLGSEVEDWLLGKMWAKLSTNSFGSIFDVEQFLCTYRKKINNYKEA